jgi:endonuclease/exonuclease/phosphatase (EEP) superfamily protein YafD
LKVFFLGGGEFRWILTPPLSTTIWCRSTTFWCRSTTFWCRSTVCPRFVHGHVCSSFFSHFSFASLRVLSAQWWKSTVL